MLNSVLRNQRDNVMDTIEEQIGELICKKKQIDKLSNIVDDLVRLNDEIHDIEMDLYCAKLNSEECSLVSFWRKKRHIVIGEIEDQIGELMYGKRRIDKLIYIVKDLVHLNDKIYDIEIDLDCEKLDSEEYSSVLWLRKQRDCVIGVLEEQIGELICDKKRIDGLIDITKDLFRLNDEIHNIEKINM